MPNDFDSKLSLIAKSSFVILFGVILSKIFTYAYRIIIARYFGPEVYGLFSLALMVVGWFIAISSLGLSEGIVRYLAYYNGKKQEEKSKIVFQYSLFLTLFSSLFASIVLFSFSEEISLIIFNSSELIIFLKLFSLTIPFSVLASIYLSTLRSYEKISEYSFVFNVSQNFSKLLFLILMIFLGFNSNSVIFSYMIGVFFMFFFSYLFCRLRVSHLFEKSIENDSLRKEVRSSLLSYSIPLMFFGALYTIFYWTDTFFIGYFKTPSEVGLYNAIIPIATLLNIAPFLFIQLFFPIITKEFSKKNNQTIRELSKQVGKWILIVNLPLLALFILFPEKIISILFGSDYISASLSLIILSLGVMFSSLFILSNQLLSMIGKSKLILLDMIIAFLLNVFLNYLLIPKNYLLGIDNSSGLIGAAISTTISVIFLHLLFLVQTKKTIDIVPLRRKMVLVVISWLLSTTTLYYLIPLFEMSIYLFFTLIIVYLFFYVILLFLTRCFDKNDFLVYEKIKNKLLN